MDVVIFHDLPQQPHSAAFIFGRHVSGIVESLRHFGKIVGVDDDGPAPQFGSSAGELADDQHAAFVYLSRTELFCYQIHAILERSDQADVGRPIVGE